MEQVSITLRNNLQWHLTTFVLLYIVKSVGHITCVCFFFYRFLKQECHTKSSLLHAINGPTENINNNNGIDDNANDNLSMRFISMVQYRKQPVLIGSPLDSMFGENESSKVLRLPQDGLRSCYKSKVFFNKMYSI